MDPAHHRAHRRLWTDLVRRAQPGYVAAPACLLALTAWQGGDGALANRGGRPIRRPRRLAVLGGQAAQPGVPSRSLRSGATAAAPGSSKGIGRPLLVGGEGERRTLPAAAAYADAVNWQVGVRDFVRKRRVLREACEVAGRDPDAVRLTHAPNFQLFDSEREFARWRQNERRGMSSEDVYVYIRNRGALYGTLSAAEETIEEFTDAGCRGFMVSCNSAPAVGALDQMASLAPVRHALCQPSGSAR